MKTKSPVKNSSGQQTNKITPKYKFTYSTYAIETMYGILMMIVYFSILYRIIYFANNYHTAVYLIAIPILVLSYVLAVPIRRILRRKGTGILHENHLELYLHKTKHIIEYNKIKEVETQVQRSGTIHIIRIKGKKAISIYKVPGKVFSDSQKSIVIFQEALIMKLKEKGFTNVNVVGAKFNKIVLEEGSF